MRGKTNRSINSIKKCRRTASAKIKRRVLADSYIRQSILSIKAIPARLIAGKN